MGGGWTVETGGATGSQQGVHEGVFGAAQDTDGDDVRRLRFAGRGIRGALRGGLAGGDQGGRVVRGEGSVCGAESGCGDGFYRAGDGEERAGGGWKACDV